MKMRFAEHTVRMGYTGKMGYAYKIYTGNPEGKQVFGVLDVDGTIINIDILKS
jgi:hypothetical protein